MPTEALSRTEDALRRALWSSFHALRHWRRTYRDLVLEYIGNMAGQNLDASFMAISADQREQVLMLIQEAAQARMVSLAMNRPRVMCSTDDNDHWPFATKFQLTMNRHLETIHLEYPLQEAVLNACFTFGVVKVGYMDTGYVYPGEQADDDIPDWRPDARSVSVENYVVDRTATDPRRVHFAGDGYRVPFDNLKDPRFDQTVVRQLEPTTKYRPMQTDGEPTLKRYEWLDSGQGDPDDVVPGIDLVDVWLPLDGQIVTYAVTSPMNFRGPMQKLATTDWDGLACGPFHELRFINAPENLLAGGPANNIQRLARLANSLIRKQAKRASRQKQLTLYSAKGVTDADTLRREMEGGYAGVLYPDAVKSFSTPGADPNTTLFFHEVVGLLDRMSGNTPARLGLAAQSPTARQEEIVHAQVTRAEALEGNAVANFTHAVCLNLACLIWKDDGLTIQNEYQVPNTEYRVRMDWRPGERAGRFEDYHIRIDPYSMQFRTPRQVAEETLGIVERVCLKNPELLMAQGGNVNMAKLMEMLADLLDRPELKQIVTFSQPGGQPYEQAGPSLPSGGGRGVGDRTYARAPRPVNPARQAEAERMNQLAAAAAAADTAGQG